MPFTPAHPALIVPLLKSRKFSATGLIVGSVVPDFEYFFKMSARGTFSHSVSGLLYFDIPVVFVLSLLFHQIVKRNLIDNLPIFFQRRFQDTRNFNFISYLKSHFGIFLLSGSLGAISHLLWDSLTHRRGFFSQLFNYHNVIIKIENFAYPLVNTLQHLSTFLGLAIVGICILRKPVSLEKLEKPKIWYWVALIIVTLFIYWLRYYIQSYDFNYANKIVTMISAGLCALIICGIIRFKKSSAQEQST